MNPRAQTFAAHCLCILVMSNTTPTGPQQAAPLMDSYQPTVRVMRLYKPGFHLVQSLPHIPHTFAADNINYDKTSGSDFTLSPFLLLPDSFGDIYAGEKFSAYIAVVNGFAQVPFYQVNLAVRLQTSTTVIDLADTRANAEIAGSNQYHSKTLNCNETFDMIVSQTLTELGIHTLRVSVQYLLTPTSEVKTLRKFYRFNVLQPLVIQSSFIEVNGKPMVQCEVTNATKSPIYIDEFTYIPTNRGSVCVPVTGNPAATAPGAQSEVDALVLSDGALTEDLKLLQTGESCAFSFVFTEYSDLSGKPPGFPQVKWCTSMGEFSLYRGDFTYARNGSDNAQAGVGGQSAGDGPRSIRFECLTPPGEMYVGEEASIVIRVHNTTQRAMSVHLDCKNSTAPNPNTIGTSKSGASIRPRLSTTSSGASYANVLAAQNTNSASGGAGGRQDETSAGSGAGAAQFSQRGLNFSGLTFTPLGIIESADFTDVTVSVYATSAGLHYLPTLYLIDSITGERHPIAAACRVLVHDSEEWDEDSSEPDQGAREQKTESPRILAAKTLVKPVVHVLPPPPPAQEEEVLPAVPDDAADVPVSAPSPVAVSINSDVAKFLEESEREMNELLGETADAAPVDDELAEMV